VDPNSTSFINFIGMGATVHADFGSGRYDGQSIGIPYQVVTGTQAKVTIKLGAYASEDDPGPMPIPSNALIEGYPKPGNGDRHVLVLEKAGCRLYELGAAVLKNGAWSADAAAVFDDPQRAAAVPVSASPARPDYHAPSPRPVKTGHFYFAGNRTFLLCVDTVAVNRSHQNIESGRPVVCVRTCGSGWMGRPDRQRGAFRQRRRRHARACASRPHGIAPHTAWPS
jgi:hypothetical protein